MEGAESGALRFEPGERVGVLGGTFDPIHRAHLHLADAAAAALRLDRLILMPAGDPWRKQGRGVTPAPHRYAMAAAVAAERGGGLELSDLEVRRDGPSYTLETAQALNAAGAEPQTLWWIVGADALLDLPNWHEPSQLLRHARLAVAARPGHEVHRTQLDRLLPGLSRWLDWVPMEAEDLSASDLRDRIRRGEDVSADLPAAALSYIRRHHLYRVD